MLTITADQAGGDARSSEASRRGRRWAKLAERFGLIALLLVMTVAFAAALPGTFATISNLRAVLIQVSVVGVAALGVVFPLVCGRFDLSVGTVVVLTSIACAAAMANFGLPLGVAIAVSLVLGTVIGIVNGILVAYCGINSLICTIGSATILGGLVTAYTKGINISAGLSPMLTDLSIRTLAGVPVLTVITIAFVAATSFLLNKTVFGRRLRAIGSNESAAALTGLPVRRTVMLSFAIAGLLGGCAGVLQVAYQGGGNPQVSGLAFLLPAVAAVFLGATTITPGEYNMPGTMVALLFVAVAVSGLTLWGVSSWITDVFTGVTVIVAVGLSAALRRRRTGLSQVGG